jgi:release factor glutamine methyltransferase
LPGLDAKEFIMLLKNYKTIFLQELSSLYDEKEIERFFYLVLENVHHKKRIDLALNPGMEIDAAQVQRWESILVALKKHKPIQYILGETEFYGLLFLVDGNVLIPRPETEELVELIISNNLTIQKSNCLKILDIGTGSGCIPISLKMNLPNAEVFAIDVSKGALATAKKNAELNKTEVTFLLQNILETEDLQQQFDIIVSNPPYVRNMEKAEINPNVLEYEPHLALFVEDDDALLFYRKIAQLARKNLNPNGQLYFEINQYLGKETVELLRSLDFKSVVLHKDIYENDRMISCNL